MPKDPRQTAGEPRGRAELGPLNLAEASKILRRLDALEERVGLLHDSEEETARTHVWVLTESWTKASKAVGRLEELGAQARALSLRSMGRIQPELVDFLREVGKLS
jgi:hypothetical protein